MWFFEIAAIIIMATIAAWLIVVAGLFILGVIAAAITTAHEWEEWSQERPDDRKGKENRDNAEF